MKELTGKELKIFLFTATQKDIIEYWKQITAPKYGYKKLVEPKTGRVVASV